MAKKCRSFRELEGSEEVTINDLRDCLRDYAEGGWAISAEVVIAIIGRVKNLNEESRSHLIASAIKGAQIQQKMNFPKDEREYKIVIKHLQY